MKKNIWDRNLLTLIFIIFLIYLLFQVFLWFFDNSYRSINLSTSSIEGFVNGNYKYTRCVSYPLDKITRKVFKKHGIRKKSLGEQWNIYMPCGYNSIEKQLLNLKHPSKDKDNDKDNNKDNNEDNTKNLVFGIKGCDSIVSKNSIWKILVNKYGTEGASQLMPKTYVPHLKKDLISLKKDITYSNENANGDPKRKPIYILKKNIQRQQGIKLCEDLGEILENVKTDKTYAVIQEYLNNPYCINGHKINLRIYLLVTCHGGRNKAYVYKNGFLYYTPKPFEKGTLDIGKNITSGYVPRKMYEINPLTHDDLRKYLEKNENKGSSKILFSNINILLNKVMQAVGPHLCRIKELQDCFNFQLFGVDIAPDENLGVKLIEMNKGPDMGAKDKRDGDVKFRLVEDIFNLNGVLSYDEMDRKNGFHKIWEN